MGGSWEDLCDSANAALSDVGPIKGIAEALKIRPLAVFLFLAFFTLGFILYGFCGQLICTVVSLAYPAFESFKALESKNHQQMSFWLTYWVVFSTMTLMEGVYYYLLVWLPFYYPLKLGFLFWLFLPQTCGAEYVYRWAVMPLLVKNRDHFDSVIDKTSKELKRSLSSIPTTVSASATVAASGALVIGASAAASLRRRLSSNASTIFTSEADATPKELRKDLILDADPQAEADDGEVRYDAASRTWEIEKKVEAVPPKSMEVEAVPPKSVEEANASPQDVVQDNDDNFAADIPPRKAMEANDDLDDLVFFRGE